MYRQFHFEFHSFLGTGLLIMEHEKNAFEASLNRHNNKWRMISEHVALRRKTNLAQREESSVGMVAIWWERRGLKCVVLLVSQLFPTLWALYTAKSMRRFSCYSFQNYVPDALKFAKLPNLAMHSWRSARNSVPSKRKWILMTSPT